MQACVSRVGVGGGVGWEGGKERGSEKVREAKKRVCMCLGEHGRQGRWRKREQRPSVSVGIAVECGRLC